MRPNALTIGDFEGTWQVARRIVQRGGASARFEGQAVWSPGAAGLDYLETGTLYVEGQRPMTAERRYRWDSDLRVFFEDGRFFHQVPRTGGATEHWCAPDMYRVRYRFARWPEWETVWRVIGPRKDYAMITRYTRADT